MADPSGCSSERAWLTAPNWPREQLHSVALWRRTLNVGDSMSNLTAWSIVERDVFRP